MQKYENYSSIDIVSRKMAKDLERFNITPRKTKKYTFPNVDPDLVKHFMRGYFDGDGGVSINKKSQAAISVRGTESFLLSYRDFLVKYSGVNPVKVSLSSGIFIIQYCGNGNARKIFSWLYDDGEDYLDRKFEIAKRFRS